MSSSNKNLLKIIGLGAVLILIGFALYSFESTFIGGVLIVLGALLGVGALVYHEYFAD
jgi:hypothetical protein